MESSTRVPRVVDKGSWSRGAYGRPIPPCDRDLRRSYIQAVHAGRVSRESSAGFTATQLADYAELVERGHGDADTSALITLQRQG